ncbi:hypothetical protein [Nitratifractor sp.]|uniref:hypothetical protein n=1 Tax=Nitratifractor sp. TaxID=2268144 RepID=UPI0025F84A2F|nr:hypothetical protein [Nitratifractor sp.]
MQLNEIIEENTLPTISRRTRIAVENLDALLHRDWSRLKKVQALGFISILEREYHVDLSDLKADCRAYFAEAGPVEEAPPLIVTPAAEEEQGKGWRILLLILVLIAAFGGWRYFSTPAGSESNVTTTTASRKGGGFFDSVFTMTKGWFGGEKPSLQETEIASSEPPAVSGAWAEQNESEKNQTVQVSSPSSAATSEENLSSEEKHTPKPTPAAGEENEEAKIITQVKKEQAKAEELRRQSAAEPKATSAEENLSDLSRMILAATAGNGEAKPPQEKALAPTVPSMEQHAEKKKAPASQSDQKTVSAPKAAKAPQSAAAASATPPKPAAKKTAVTDALVIFHPRSKVWVGYTDLRTMKRVAKVTNEDITFDTSKGDYILATGHGRVEFRGKNSLKLADGSRHFFMIAQGGVREISHEAFQRLNKSKVW